MQGNVSPYIAVYPGDPTGVDPSIFDAPQGALVLDSTGGAPKFKTTGRNDNSGLMSVANGIASTLSNVPAGTVTQVPANSQAIVFGTWTITGTVNVYGEVRVGPWPF